MISFLAILIVVALNLVPGNVTTFTIQMNEKESISFTKQSDGGWKAVALPKDDLGTYQVDGAKLTINGQGKTYTQDFSTMLGVDKNSDWKNLKAIRYGDTPVLIDRKENGFDLIRKVKEGGGETNQIYKVRWEIMEHK